MRLQSLTLSRSVGVVLQDFFGHRKLLASSAVDGSAAQLTTQLRQLSAAVFSPPNSKAAATHNGLPLDLSSVERVLVFGEIAGGHYPHAKIAAVAGVTPVQTGIWYSPDVFFYAFDAAIDSSAG